MNPAWMTLILSLPMLTLLHLLSKFINWQRSSGTFSTMTGRPTWSYSNVSRILTMTLPDTQFRSSRRQIWSILPVTWRNLQGLLSNEARRMEISARICRNHAFRNSSTFLVVSARCLSAGRTWTPEWTSRDSNHHQQSVSAAKTNAIPTEPSGRLAKLEQQGFGNCSKA